MEATETAAAEAATKSATKNNNKPCSNGRSGGSCRSRSIGSNDRDRGIRYGNNGKDKHRGSGDHDSQRGRDVQRENLNNNSTAQQTGTAHPFQTTVGVAEAGTSTSNQGRPAPPSRTTGPRDPIQEEDHQQATVDWDLPDEDALLEGSTLSSSKSLMNQYLEDEANSKKTKKTNTGKGKKGNPKNNL